MSQRAPSSERPYTYAPSREWAENSEGSVLFVTSVATRNLSNSNDWAIDISSIPRMGRKFRWLRPLRNFRRDSQLVQLQRLGHRHKLHPENGQKIPMAPSSS